MASAVKNVMSPFLIKASAKHTASFIFLHGLGDTGAGWCEGFKTIKSDHIKYIFPNAPIQPVTINFNQKMPSWFDIISLDRSGGEDEAGILNASDTLRELIREEIASGIAADRIIVGGFSQGGAVATYTSLTSDTKLAGVLLLSTYLPLASKFPAALKLDKETPVYQCHGGADPVVSVRFGKLSHEILKGLLHHVEFKLYKDLGHSSSAEEMQGVEKWVTDKLPQI